MDSIQLQSYFDLLLLKLLREGLQEEGDAGEGKFGLAPLTADPNTLLSSSGQRAQKKLSDLRPHPLLSRSAQFSGVDRRLTADPVHNAEAQEQYPQKRLERNLNKNLMKRFQQQKAPPRLIRS